MRDAETGLYVGYVPGLAGAHSQGETLEELNVNLREVIAMLLEDGEPDGRRVPRKPRALAMKAASPSAASRQASRYAAISSGVRRCSATS